MKLVAIDETTLEGLAKENLVSPESIQPLENYFSEDKQKELANDIFNPVAEGYEDAAKVHALGKFLAKLGSDLASLSLDQAIREVEEHGGKNVSLYGVKFEVKNTPPVFDFDFDQTYKDFNEAVKARKDQLVRAFKSKEVLIDPETGEEIPKAKLKKPSGTTIAISFK